VSSLIFDFCGENASLFEHVAAALGAAPGRMERRRFPDGESYVRFDDDCRGRQVVIMCSLDRPDRKVTPLLLAAATLRDLGAADVGLVAPYLAYMRQDKRFRPGEGVTARYFADLISTHFDWLVTVDPHLHRILDLDEIYTIPSFVVHAAPDLATWIRSNVPDPLIIGPDSESEQWVADVAAGSGAPFQILQKVRSGDRRVKVSVPDLTGLRGRNAVLIDDIISTGHTMVAAIEHLRAERMPPPVCVAIHGIFAEGADAALKAAGAAQVVTCNTIGHESNAIDLSRPIAAAVRALRAGNPARNAAAT